MKSFDLRARMRLGIMNRGGVSVERRMLAEVENGGALPSRRYVEVQEEGQPEG